MQKLIRSALFAGLGMVAMLFSYGVAVSANETAVQDTPSISAIMKAHGGKDGYLAKIKGSAAAGKWDDAAASATALAKNGEALTKNKPSKGDAKSWETLAKKYQENTQAVSKAVTAKDEKAVTASLGAIQKSCGECHKVHK